MAAKLLANKLPLELIQIIQQYQCPIKDSQFIVRWMKRLTYRNSKQNQIYWKFMVRDSQDLIILMPQHQLDGFNFACFVQDFIKNNLLKYACKYFEIFCKNAIANNPSLLLNRYYVGNGGSPCYQMISTFLFTNRINGSQVAACQQIQDSLFNIYQFMMENQYLNSQHCYRFFYGFNHGFYTAKYTVQVLQIFFQHNKEFFQDADIQDIQVDYYRNTKQMVNSFFKNLFEQMSKKQNDLSQYMWRRMKHDQNQFQIQKAKTKQFLRYFQERHYAILDKYTKHLIQETFKFIDIKTLQFLIVLPGFKPLLFNENYVFSLINKRRFKQFSLLWSFEEQRPALSKFKLNGKNILEIAAENRGLSQNFIDILWRSKLFQTLPTIKNEKSKTIIQVRFNI